MTRAAESAAGYGAKVIDITYGCPARVVCGKACGSAIMREPELAQAIMRSVVGAVASGGVPVTVKMRSGWDEASKNAVELAQMAEDAGVSALTVHGRTRAQRFTGAVNPKDIAAVVRAVSIPVVANGDIASPEGARRMIDATGAAGVMIGRAARGNPWLLGRAREVLAGRADPGAPTIDERRRVVLKHLAAQGEAVGGRIGQSAVLGPHDLHEIHLPPVAAGVRAGALGFMAAYNDIDSVPCCAIPWLLKDYLRDQLGFDGIVMADGLAVDRLEDMAGSIPAAGRAALLAGVDVSLWDEGFARLEEYVDDEQVAAAVDTA